MDPLVFSLAEAVNLAVGALLGQGLSSAAEARSRDTADRRLGRIVAAAIRGAEGLSDAERGELVELAAQTDYADLLVRRREATGSPWRLTPGQQDWETRLERLPASVREPLMQDIRMAISGSLSPGERVLSARMDAILDAVRSAEGPESADAAREYLGFVSSLMPKAGLVGRERELRDSERFASGAGPEHWMWWEAGPWAGKTALMSQLATETIPGVRIVSFFVVGRDARYSDSAGFLAHVLPQLAQLAGQERCEVPAGIAESGRRFTDLLARAAERCRAQGERLLLLVDGLDEDRHLTDPHRRLSIAACLPPSLPDGVRVLVASRESPQLPDDVPDQHPLRSLARRRLGVSPAATAMRSAAERELREVLDASDASHGGVYGRDVLAFISASGSGLTVSDLVELTGATPHELKRMLGGRSFVARVLRGGGTAYTLGHEMLDRMVIEEHLGGRGRAVADPAGSQFRRAAALAPWRLRLIEWAQRWAELGWPEDTPEYLLSEAYPALAAGSPELLEHIVDVVVDGRRVERLRESHSGDWAAIRQLRALADAVTRQWDDRDETLGRAARIFERLDACARRNAVIPEELPEVYALLERTEWALGLARSVTDPADRASALLRVASTFADVGRIDGARRAAAESRAAVGNVDGIFRRLRLLCRLVPVHVMVNDPESALALISELRSEYLLRPEGAVLDRSLGLSARALLHLGMPEEAAALAREAIGVVRERSRARDVAVSWFFDHELLAEMLGVLAETGDIRIPGSRSGDVVSLGRVGYVDARIAVGACRYGDLPAARTAARSALAETAKIDDAGYRAEARSEIAPLLVEAGQIELGVSTALGVELEPLRARALCAVVAALPAEVRDVRAAELLREARASASELFHEYTRGEVLTDVAHAYARIGDARTAVEILDGLRAEGHLDGTDHDANLSLVHVEAGELDEAMRVAERLASAEARGRALAQLARARAERGETELALAAADAAGVAANEAPALPWSRQLARHAPSTLLGIRGFEEALSAVNALRPGWERAASRAKLAGSVRSGEQPDPDRDARRSLAAEALAEARDLESDYERGFALAGVLPPIVRSGIVADARETLRSIPEGTHQWSSGALAAALAESGEFDLAAEILPGLPDDAERLTGFAAIARSSPSRARAEAARRSALGLFDAVFRSAEPPSWGAQWDSGRITAARSLASLGELDLALAEARAFPTWNSSACAIAGIARLVVETDAASGVLLAEEAARDLRRAVPEAARLWHPDERSGEMLELGRALDRLVETAVIARGEGAPAAERMLGHAAQLLVELWSAAGSPWCALTSFGLLAPRALGALLEEERIDGARGGNARRSTASAPSGRAVRDI